MIGYFGDIIFISIHAPARGATRPWRCRPLRQTISIHAPARGATYGPSVPQMIKNISIHAPARGATVPALTTHDRHDISIHAPARGATVKASVSKTYTVISIHAPARGATTDCGHNQDDFYFNPRSREGSDTVWPSNSFGIVAFQSTLPRGERPPSLASCAIFASFQSTLPRGERRRVAARFHITFLFQSTLPRGERQRDEANIQTLTEISIHAPARGATSILSKIHPMFLTISHNASSFSSFPFHSFLPHLLNSSTFCALFQVRISRAFSVYYRFAPKKSTPDL